MDVKRMLRTMIVAIPATLFVLATLAGIVVALVTHPLISVPAFVFLIIFGFIYDAMG